MRASGSLVGLTAAVALLSSLPETLAHEQQGNGLWARLRRALGKADVEEKQPEPDHSHYGGPPPGQKDYTYPPYGYPPPPPESSYSEVWTSSWSSEEPSFSSWAESFSSWLEHSSEYSSEVPSSASSMYETSATDAYGSSVASASSEHPASSSAYPEESSYSSEAYPSITSASSSEASSIPASEESSISYESSTAEFYGTIGEQQFWDIDSFFDHKPPFRVSVINQSEHFIGVIRIGRLKLGKRSRRIWFSYRQLNFNTSGVSYHTLSKRKSVYYKSGVADQLYIRCKCNYASNTWCWNKFDHQRPIAYRRRVICREDQLGNSYHNIGDFSCDGRHKHHPVGNTVSQSDIHAIRKHLIRQHCSLVQWSYLYVKLFDKPFLVASALKFHVSEDIIGDIEHFEHRTCRCVVCYQLHCDCVVPWAKRFFDWLARDTRS
ncbi:hypothetical protein OQA88_7322 [Cercophora sp. LCS_1]